MTSETNNPLLHRFALFTAVSTLFLIAVGGLVTSHGVGMAVPDWPTTYGYNMFLFPFSKWIGGVFYEHSHRLVASFVGLFTTILALWLYGRKSRGVLRWGGLGLVVIGVTGMAAVPAKAPDWWMVAGVGTLAFGTAFVWPRCEPSSRLLRALGVIAFVAVVLQGVLGGLRVVLFKDVMGVFHGAIAHLFLVLLCIIVLLTSAWWARSREELRTLPISSTARALVVGLTVLIFTQLLIGATMRHQHAGLAVPDFPLAYGKVWPATDPEFIQTVNQRRTDSRVFNDITPFQIQMHMAHRIGALATLLVAGAAAWVLGRHKPVAPGLVKAGWCWFGMILLQALLGALTVWSNKAADVATAHVVLGAASLVVGALLLVNVFSRRLVCVARNTTSTVTDPVARGKTALNPSP
jgi:heme a synthase